MFPLMERSAGTKVSFYCKTAGGITLDQHKFMAAFRTLTNFIMFITCVR